VSSARSDPRRPSKHWGAIRESLTGHGRIEVDMRRRLLLRSVIEGIDAHAYSGETESERRLELEDALIANEVKALVATSRSDLLAACANNDVPTARSW
jgi:hypothetical protein